MKANILWVGAEQNNLRMQEVLPVFERVGYMITFSPIIKRGWRIYQSRRFDAVLVNVRLPDHTGFNLIKKIRKVNRHIPIFHVVGKGLPADTKKGFNAGANLCFFDSLENPFWIVTVLEEYLHQSIQTNTFTHSNNKKMRKKGLSNRNALQKMQKEFASLHGQYRSAVCRDCGWSMATYYRHRKQTSSAEISKLEMILAIQAGIKLTQALEGQLKAMLAEVNPAH